MHKVTRALASSAPAIIGGVCGWIYSQSIEGHHPSQAGWFDLRALDPISFIIQDLFFAVVFGCLASALFIGLRWFFRDTLTDERRIALTSGASSLAIVIWLGNTLYHTTAERGEHEVEVRKQMAIEDKVFHDEAQAVKNSFAKLGWVRYPNVRQNDQHLKGGFEIQGPTASFMPSDDAATVINYYLSKCESWQEDGPGLRVLVRNDREPFIVRLSKHDGDIGTIWTSAEVRMTPLSHPGPTSWPLPSSPTSDVPQGSPSGALPNDSSTNSMASLFYPGAAKSEEAGSIRLWTPDDLPVVVAFYRSMGARQTDNGDDSAQNHSFEFIKESKTYAIQVSHVFQTDGTTGTLIVVRPQP